LATRNTSKKGFFAVKLPNELYKNALSYRDMGLSVIPIWGDRSPDRFKAAAVRWSAFQKRRPTSKELHHWFVEKQYAGLAIVCGRVSQLAVLDFDDEHLATLFTQLHPDLAKTRRVRSGGRGLPHFYYHVPTHFRTRSRHLAGVDWQFDGAYVVAPPTAQADAMWTVEYDIAPRILSEADLSRIMSFLDSVQEKVDQPAAKTLSAPSMPLYSNADGLKPAHVVQYYKERVASGRNNALFRTCLWIRRMGGNQNDAMPLIQAHTYQPANGNHPDESPGKRRVEAVKTIFSAFSRSGAITRKSTLKTIPNYLRERLLRDKQTAVLRVLEAMLHAQWYPEREFTRTELLKITQKVGIGEWSVRKALLASSPDGKAFFAAVAKSAIAAAKDGDKSPELNAIELRVTEPTEKNLSQRGRPQKVYVMPSLRGLCERYGITFLAGDSLQLDSLKSPKCYRIALHHALLVRRPGAYHRGWLARRLGVSIRTLCRYNAGNGIRVTPQYVDRPLIWQNVNKVIPADMASPVMSRFGAFLEDDQGKRYPPFRQIAHKLLSQKRRVMYRRRTLNYYSVFVPMSIGRPTISKSQSESGQQSVNRHFEQINSLSKTEVPVVSKGYSKPPLALNERPLHRRNRWLWMNSLNHLVVQYLSSVRSNSFVSMDVLQ
jgi:hypothetical protein